MDGGAGDDVMRGDDGDDQMWGMDGADIMFGDAGADQMWGRDGRDILFGGPGADLVDGGAGDDIVASGSLSYESDPVGLSYLRAEWTSGHDYWDRVHNLRGDPSSAPPLNNGYVLETQGTTPTVTHPPTAEDSLIGGLMTATDPNHDWFFGHADEYGTTEAGEAVNA
jgi:Ca2+-binding RTX toxin-like protein